MKKPILLTRPLADSLSTQASLKAEGIASLIAPMLRIRPRKEAMEELRAIPPQNITFLVATSRHAVDALPAPKHYQTLPLYVVGKRTAAAATENGWAAPAYIALTGKALARALPEPNCGEKYAIYLRGEEISHDIAAMLPQHHWKEIIAYHAEATPDFPDTIAQALLNGEIGTVCHYSRRSAEAFEKALAALPATPHDLRAICLSQTIASALNPTLWRHIQVAKSPTSEAMFTLIRSSQ